MRVTLSANAPYYLHTALALQEAGYLQEYICAVGVSNRWSWVYGFLPDSWEKKLRGREIPAVDPERVKSIWLPEVLQKGLPKVRLISKERGNWLNNHLYDRLSSRYVKGGDVFHFMTSTGLYSARKAKALGAIVVCDQNAAYPDFEREMVREECAKLGVSGYEVPWSLYEEKKKAEYDLADYLILPSEFAKRTFMQAGYDPDRMFVVPYGAEIMRHDAALGGENGVFRIICVAQIVPRKGIHYLVQAFEELGLPDAELLLVGAARGEMRSIVKGWVNRNPRIVATGSVPRLQLREHYGRSSISVLPSVSEGSALAIYDSMAAGLPMVVTENTGSEELVRDGSEGFVIPIRDVEQLKEKILALYEDSGLRKEMGESARERIEQFSWERYRERLTTVYEEIAYRESITL